MPSERQGLTVGDVQASTAVPGTVASGDGPTARPQRRSYLSRLVGASAFA